MTLTLQAKDGSVVIRTWEIPPGEAEVWNALFDRRYGSAAHEYLAGAEAANRIGGTALEAVEKDAITIHRKPL